MSARLASTLSMLSKTFGVRAGGSTREAVTACLDSAALFKLPDLAYGYGELEPTISGEIMQLHHSKHHQAYINNLKVGPLVRGARAARVARARAKAVDAHARLEAVASRP